MIVLAHFQNNEDLLEILNGTSVDIICKSICSKTAEYSLPFIIKITNENNLDKVLSNLKEEEIWERNNNKIVISYDKPKVIIEIIQDLIFKWRPQSITLTTK